MVPPSHPPASDPAISPLGTGRFETLVAALTEERRGVLDHPLYTSVDDVRSLRIFMASHAFAVWDFMSLLKTLQQRLTCVTTPWLPPKDTIAARLVNEIVLGEETDEVEPGRYVSHYELYLSAMEEVDADSNLVREFVVSLEQGFPFARVMEGMPILPSTRQFVQDNLTLCREGTTIQVASAFLLGREDLVPRMFERLVGALKDAQLPCHSFRLYLARHIDLDGGTHGPMARQLLERLCGTSQRKWDEATEAARVALVARGQLWTGIHELIRNRVG